MFFLRLFIVFVGGILFTSLLSCNDETEKSNDVTNSSISSVSSLPDSVNYRIVNEELRSGASTIEETIKMNDDGVSNVCNLEIQLNRKVDKSTLYKIARELRQSRQQYDKLWIFYRISNTTSRGSAWAISHFTPELDLQILGSTEEEDQRSSVIDNVEGEIVGKWRSDKSLSGAALFLIKDNKGNFFVLTKFKDGSESKISVKESKQGNSLRYDDGNPHGEYYLIEANGNLGMYGTSGMFDEAQKI